MSCSPCSVFGYHVEIEMNRKIVTIGMNVGLFESFRGAFSQEDIPVIACAGIDEAKAIMVQEIIAVRGVLRTVVEAAPGQARSSPPSTGMV